jgi:LDH2 family malate/lactate/ureidoglycolate dehydrogenase
MSLPVSRVPAALLRQQIETVLRAWGMAEAAVAVTAEIMIETDLAGIESHGVSMLAIYDGMRRTGKLNLKAAPRVVRQSATTALIDAEAGLGHPAAAMAMDLAIDKALAHDVAVVSVVNSHHFGAAGCYAARAARRGVIGLVASSTRFVSLVPTRAAEPVLGTNPLAFAAPAGRNPPVLLDIATTVVAINKIKVYGLKGEPIPEGWVIDGQGRPITDAAAALRQVQEDPEGGVNPIGGDGQVMGGHKGYGLSLLAHILGGTLAGSSFSPIRNRTQQPGDPDNIGHCFLALNPAAFRPAEEFAADLDQVIDTLHAARPTDPARPVLVAGDPERLQREDRLAHGIPLHPALRDQLRRVAEAAGVPYILG